MPKHAPTTAPTRVSTGRDPPPSVCAASGRVTEVEETVEKLGGTILKSKFVLPVTLLQCDCHFNGF